VSEAGWHDQRMSEVGTLAHRVRRMSGRDPDESGRASTPLELLFDLTFVVAVGQAANLLAHSVFEGHAWTGLIAFAVAVFAIVWAWINFSWFASAFDTDDWVFRSVTMVQMVGVCIAALGLPNLFHSIEEGGHVDNRVLVIGYVIMRLAMVSQWLRAARQSPDRRASCLAYASWISAAQVGWVVLAILNLSLLPTLLAIAVLNVIEFYGPWRAEHLSAGRGTPWHAHHIAERYALFAIIALGEGVVGTVAALSSVEEEAGGITADVLVVGAAGIALTFGMWWTYFTVPSGEVLHAHRERGFVWGYGQMLVFGSIIATGAGLHVAALRLEDESHIGALGAVLSVAVPVGCYLVSLIAVYTLLVGELDLFHVWLVLGTLAVLAVAVLLAAAGVGMPVCLLVVAASVLVPVIGYELGGHRRMGAATLRATAERA
jgi:low temperature requirement protein LtrA